jgi:dolichyl-diphosphooligosaccharide--protein glycosyltransferase
MLIVLFPVGCYMILAKSHFDETELLLLTYGLSTLCFVSIMSRLVPVFKPAMVLVSGRGLHRVMKAVAKRRKDFLAFVLVLTLFVISVDSELHAASFACSAYSGDHLHFLVRTSRGRESSDDYREGYQWLWCNTGRNERVMSWWDYGY